MLYKVFFTACWIASSTVIQSAVAEPRHHDRVKFRPAHASSMPSTLFLHPQNLRKQNVKLVPRQNYSHVLSRRSSSKSPSWRIIPRGGEQQQSSTKISNSPTDIISSSSFNMTPFLQYNAAISIINLLGMIISLLFPRKQYHLDLLGTGAFAISAMYVLCLPATAVGVANDLTRVQISSVAVILWSVKLASFLFYRACKVKTDLRLDSLLSTPSGTAIFWMLSLLWGVLSSLPHSLGLTSSLAGNNVALAIGTLVFASGFLIETISDFQKWAWKQSNPDKFCNVGLWSASQHPNYFGNLLIWSGITIMNFPALMEPLSGFSGYAGSSIIQGVASFLSDGAAAVWSVRRGLVACISPFFLWSFFMGQAKGVVNSAVERSMDSYGDDPEFRKYIDTVPLILPDLKRVLSGNDTVERN